ncbi:MerR family transcriptional regulator [Paenibacillus cymbidii]|uniref:MerR family transcriptional regulator n=1 Tax=Paenibacillus cymbidii TaxID=1639034 RepID=UPI001F250F55|nr:MerR family transcriptional regulator [Paenibacillus cymbidii]
MYPIYTTGQLERETGITERTIAYYNSLGLLSLEKMHGKMIVTDEDLRLLVKIFLMKITHTKLKDIRRADLEHKPFAAIIRQMETMNEQVFHLSSGMERCGERPGFGDCFRLLREANHYMKTFMS